MKKEFEQKGQALIELIVFLPLMITLYSVIGGFAGSINGSINQQKATRSYFYYRVQNSSHIPGRKAGDATFSWNQFGMFYVGWKEKFTGDQNPVMPCYRVSIPFKGSNGEKCEEPYNKENTLWVRVGTVYGVCGATYRNVNQYPVQLPDGFSGVLFDQNSCTISQ